MNKDRKYIISKIMFGLSLLPFLGLMYWLLWPYEPLVINERPVPVVEETVSKSGGNVVVYEMDYCKNTRVTPILKRAFEDGIVYSIPDKELKVEELGCRVEWIALDIPESLPVGDYILILEFHYQMNPIREVVVMTHTKKFKVIE